MYAACSMEGSVKALGPPERSAAKNFVIDIPISKVKPAAMMTMTTTPLLDTPMVGGGGLGCGHYLREKDEKMTFSRLCSRSRWSWVDGFKFAPRRKLAGKGVIAALRGCVPDISKVRSNQRPVSMFREPLANHKA